MATMPRTEPFKRFLKNYEEDMIARDLCAETRYQYLRVCNTARKILKARGFQTHPEKIGRSELLYLKSQLKSKWTLTVFGTFLDHCGNNTLRRMRINWPKDRRIRADWLSKEQAKVVMALANPGLERLLIHFELECGMRRIELRRLKLSDIREKTIDILGKGRGGGKWRTIPKHPDTDMILVDWLPEREKLLKTERNPHLFIHRRKGKATQYSIAWFDTTIQKISRRCGFKFSHHTLRRTFGKNLYGAGVKVPTIATILGHEDTKTTIRYLGIDLDDMSEAMLKGAQRYEKCSLPHLSQ